MKSDPKAVRELLQDLLHSGADASQLLQYLVELQYRFQYIPQIAIDELSQSLKLSHGYIESVISFYTFLEIDPGRYRLLFSDNITDQFSGNRDLQQQLMALVGDTEGVSVGFTSCTGLCDQGPAMLANGRAINHLDSSRIRQIAELVLAGQSVDQWPAQWFKIDQPVRRKDIQLQQPYEKGRSIKQVLADGVQTSLRRLQRSGLRGRGGAGFATVDKWRICMQNDEKTRYVVCNADEGEPGTFKDRVLLAEYADEVIEGMTVCAHIVGAQKGFIYLRAEYRFLLDQLNETLQSRREQGLLGRAIGGEDGFDFDIDIHLGAGAYICGEESALIESMEGKRGLPRVRPPFPVNVGYLGKPTVVNNVETYWSVNAILSQQDEAWFTQCGTEKSAGTRLLSISGDCTKPGVYEFPFGVSIEEILVACGGSQAQAIQMAGAAGRLILAGDFQRQLSFEDLPTGGSFMVIGAERDLLDVIANFAAFFKHESCGFCTPCRVGTVMIDSIVQRFVQGKGSRADLAQLETIRELMVGNSFCGLGKTASTALSDFMQCCPQRIESTFAELGDNPVFDLKQAVSEYEQIIQQGVEGMK